MKWLKRLGRSTAARQTVAWTAGIYLTLIYRTTRWRQEIPSETQALLEADRPFLVAFWHGRMVLMRAAWPGRPQDLHMLISEHADGQMIAKGMAQLGFSTIAGSSRRRGAVALREMHRRLKAGAAVGITPDGPKGPRMRAKPGVVAAARAAGAPIVPLSGAASRTQVLGTWDRFNLVLPFGRGLLLWGKPLDVPPDADETERERLRARLEAEMNRLSAEADRRMGRAAVEPAPQGAAPHEIKRGGGGMGTRLDAATESQEPV
jgi:lysophospholipid acyltransferase (LPLAT)-like uncharacterized protein